MKNKQDLIVFVSAIVFFLCIIGYALTGIVMVWICSWSIFAKLFVILTIIGILSIFFIDFIS